MTKEKRRTIWMLVVSLGYLYMLVDRQKYPLPDHVKMTQIEGVESPLNSLELLISYFVIVSTAAVTLFFIFKTLKE